MSNKNSKILIKDTTREEREAIVRKGLMCDSCDGCSSCGIYGAGDMLDMYAPYINGEKELSEINEEFRSGLVK